jgi:hypothetical protein
MVIGADVSHPAPGAGSGEAASFAAITVSADPLFARYWAEVQTNGNRVEMVTTSNIEKHFQPMAKNWMQRVGRGQPPERVLYIRDGVSEGQYAAVLEEEVRDFKEAFTKMGCKTIPKFTVVIAGSYPCSEYSSSVYANSNQESATTSASSRTRATATRTPSQVLSWSLAALILMSLTFTSALTSRSRQVWHLSLNHVSCL